MEQAMDDTGVHGHIREFVFERLALTAQHMVNTPNETGEI